MSLPQIICVFFIARSSLTHTALDDKPAVKKNSAVVYYGLQLKSRSLL